MNLAVRRFLDHDDLPGVHMLHLGKAQISLWHLQNVINHKQTLIPEHVDQSCLSESQDERK
jgi:hypothetical protein